MNELETLLKTHDWGTAGSATRPAHESSWLGGILPPTLV
jgi:hypothetical protein